MAARERPPAIVVSSWRIKYIIYNYSLGPGPLARCQRSTCIQQLCDRDPISNTVRQMLLVQLLRSLHRHMSTAAPLHLGLSRLGLRSCNLSPLFLVWGGRLAGATLSSSRALLLVDEPLPTFLVCEPAAAGGRCCSRPVRTSLPPLGLLPPPTVGHLPLDVCPRPARTQLLCEGDPLGCSTRQVLLVQLLQLRDLCSLPRLLRLRRCWLAALTWWPPRSRGRHRKKPGALQFQPRAGLVALNGQSHSLWWWGSDFVRWAGLGRAGAETGARPVRRAPRAA